MSASEAFEHQEESEKWLRVWVIAAMLRVVSEFLYADAIWLQLIFVASAIFPGGQWLFDVLERVYILAIVPGFASLDKHAFSKLRSFRRSVSTLFARFARKVHTLGSSLVNGDHG